MSTHDNPRYVKLRHLEAATDYEAGQLVVEDSFEGLLSAVRWMLDHHYPAETIVCSTHPNADPGAKFTGYLREAVAALDGTRYADDA